MGMLCSENGPWVYREGTSIQFAEGSSPKVGVFSAFSSPTFTRHPPCTALQGYLAAKVGVFFVILSPTFELHLAPTCLRTLSTLKVGVFFSIFTHTL